MIPWNRDVISWNRDVILWNHVVILIFADRFLCFFAPLVIVVWFAQSFFTGILFGKPYGGITRNAYVEFTL